MTAKKCANEAKRGYPLMVLLQGVNIDPFGFANGKRTQFPVVAERKQAAADSCYLQTTNPRTRLSPDLWPAKKWKRSHSPKSANEANHCEPLMKLLQGVNIDTFGFANSKRTQFLDARQGKRPSATSSCLLPAKRRGRRRPGGAASRDEEVAATARMPARFHPGSLRVTLSRIFVPRLGERGPPGEVTTNPIDNTNERSRILMAEWSDNAPSEPIIEAAMTGLSRVRAGLDVELDERVIRGPGLMNRVSPVGLMPIGHRAQPHRGVTMVGTRPGSADRARRGRNMKSLSRRQPAERPAAP